MPLKWDELKLGEMPKFHINDFQEWRSRLRKDPWKELLEVRQELTLKALERA